MTRLLLCHGESVIARLTQVVPWVIGLIWFVFVVAIESDGSSNFILFAAIATVAMMGVYMGVVRCIRWRARRIVDRKGTISFSRSSVRRELYELLAGVDGIGSVNRCRDPFDRQLIARLVGLMARGICDEVTYRQAGLLAKSWDYAPTDAVSLEYVYRISQAAVIVVAAGVSPEVFAVHANRSGHNLVDEIARAQIAMWRFESTLSEVRQYFRKPRRRFA